MDVSVVICTRNRAVPLGRVLRSMTNLVVPKNLLWELLVVDNGSSDDTASVAKQFTDHLPLRYLYEPCPGLSHARNRGAGAALGELICWTDDDVEVDENWLSAYCEAAERFPDAAFFGGNITPRLEGLTPGWFARNTGAHELQALMAVRHYEEVMLLSAQDRSLPYGANFAVRRLWQMKHQFDPELGVGPCHQRTGEETQLLHAIAASGGVGISVPASTVHHIIPISRQSRAYVWRFHSAHGETWALQRLRGADKLLFGEPLPVGRVAFRVPLWVVRKCIVAWTVAFIFRLLKMDAAWLEHYAKAGRYYGAARYMMKSS